MTILFLLFSFLVAWSVYNVYRPIYRRAGLSMASFLMGWLTGELALHHIAWEVFVAFLFVWGGAVHGFLGAIGFAACTISWLAAASFYFTGDRARPVIEDALRAALGNEYRAAIRDEFVARFPKGPDVARIRLPFAAMDAGVEVIKDVPFGSHDQKLDIYRPRRTLEKSPVLLQIHGGAWTQDMGSKEHQAIPLMTHMALRNWISVSIDYRLSPAATFPEHLVDCKEGLKWIKEHIEEFGGDPNFVVVTGGSAGGHLCALLALTAGDPAYQPGFEELDTRVQGAVPFYGVYDFVDDHWETVYRNGKDIIESSVMKLPRAEHQDAFKRASPLYCVNRDAPPFLVVHGDHDALVPVDQARAFVARLREVSKSPVAYAEIEGAQHAFDLFPSVRSEHTKQGVERFLTWLYSRHLAGTG